MKKIILSLMMTGLLGLAVSASAQNPRRMKHNTNPPAGPDQPGRRPVTKMRPTRPMPAAAAMPDAVNAGDATNNAAPEGNPPGAGGDHAVAVQGRDRRKKSSPASCRRRRRERMSTI